MNGPLQSASYSAVLNGNYATLTNNGVTVKRPDEAVSTNYSLVAWIDKRRNYLSSQLATVAAPFEISNNAGNNFAVTNQTSITLSGKAPVEVAIIRTNGATTNASVIWTSVTNWSLGFALAAAPSTNTITVRGFDRLNQMLATNLYQKSITITNK